MLSRNLFSPFMESELRYNIGLNIRFGSLLRWIYPVQYMLNPFDSILIRDMEVKNRFMRSATTSYYAHEDGTVRESAINLYENLAKGGIGLIIKGHLYITESGKAHQGMAGISSDIHISRTFSLHSK